MYNRALFAQKTNSVPKHEQPTKANPNTKQLTNNKISIRRCNSNQNILSSYRSKPQPQPIKIIPQILHFQSVEPQQLYQIPFFIRNQSSQLQKVRIIPPIKKQFKIKFSQSFNNEIAAGLAVKVSVLFCSDELLEMTEEKIIVMGNSFKQEVILVAQTPKSAFVIPKVLNVGTLVLKQERRIEIPIKNVGSKAGIITIQDLRTNEYCPHITYPTKSITILSGKTELLQLFIKPSTLGQLQVKISFSNMDTCVIKTLVLQDQVEIVDENGSKVSVKDFGELFVGERVGWRFFVANSTANEVEGVFQTLNKKKENTNIKIDKKRNIFISQTSPQQFSASVQSSCLSLQKLHLTIPAFTSQPNLMQVQKIPIKQQISIFIENLTKNIQSTIYKAEHNFELNNRALAASKDPNQIDFMLTGQSNNRNNNNSLGNNTNVNSNRLKEKDKVVNETLAVKFSNNQKIFKIPVKFFSKIPNLEIDLNVLEFGKLLIKEREEKQFVLKNLSNKPIKLNFTDSTTAFKENFKIEGPQILQAHSQSTFKIKFRPLIKKKFSQILRIKVFEHFPIEIKIFGECLGMDVNLAKNQMSMTMTDRLNSTTQRVSNWKSLLRDKTARQNTQNSLMMTITMNKSLNKTNKVTRSSDNFLIPSHLFQKTRRQQKPQQQQQQTARIMFPLHQQNMAHETYPKQSLYFKKQQFLTSKRKQKPYNHPSNIRQLLRYQPLSLQQLKKIQVLQKKLQFGHIFIGSTSSKKLTIKNKLEQPVLIELDTQGAVALAQNSSQPIRLQGFGTYQANITLHPTQLGQLQIPLNYIINKQHVFEVKILAIVTLVNLELSARSFVFNLTQDDPSFQKQSTLQVFNNGNKQAKFVFDQPENPSFKLSVLQGQLQPKSHMSIKIIYCPLNGHQSGEQRVDVEKLKMRVHDGAQNIIKCTGTVNEPKISIKQTEFICENSIVSVPITNKLTIKNLSKVQTHIRIQFQPQNPQTKAQEIASYITIQSSIVSLAADDKKQIPFTLICHQSKKIQLNIVVSIRGMGVTRIPFSTNVLYPDIMPLTQQINFQDVPIMSNYCIEMFSLINRTQTEIKLQIDPNYPKNEYFCEILAVKDKNLESNYEYEKYKTFLNSFIAAFKDNRRLSKRRSIVCNKILTLPPGEQSIFNLKFVPKCIMKYDFQLPLRIFGSSQKILKPVNIQIKCTAVDPVIYVQPRSIKFDMKVINQTKTSYSQSVFISNPHSYPVKFRIQPLTRNFQPLSSNNKKNAYSVNSTANEKLTRDRQQRFSSMLQGVQSFAFSLTQGQIQPNDKIEIFIMFKASCQGQFLQKFSIFLGAKNEQAKSFPTAVSSYILDISGSAIMPTLRFSCNQAILPMVPLNLQSRLFVMIQNHGYEAITICKWKTASHFPHTEIKVNFIQGKLLSLAKKLLRIQLVFSSLAPVSFTTILQFYDQYGNKYQLPISCTADNSIFTSYPYLQSDNQHTIVYNQQQKLIKIMPTGKNPYYQTSKQLSGSHSMACGFIMKWVNFQLNMGLKSYPGSVVDSEGKEFVKLVNRISSKSIIKKGEFSQITTDQQPQDNLTQSAQKANLPRTLALVQLYSQTIKKLKQQGAFLNQLRPQFLLNYSQFINYQNHKRRLVCSQAIFQVLSVESWISLFYQLCKVYVQPQITQKMVNKMKVQSTLIPTNTTSNLYSPIELMLLKFVNYYLTPQQSVSSSSPSSLAINFTQQIKIYQVIHRLLQSTFHLSLSQPLNSLKNSVAIMSPHVFLSSIAKFLYTHLKQFGLSAYLSPSDLFTMGVKQLVLYLINLFQMIYHYTNASFIRFEGAVGDKITKVIQLENPTLKKVTYLVKIVNCVGDMAVEKELGKTNSSHLGNTSDLPNKSLLLCKSSSSLSQTSFIPQVTQITICPKQKAQLKLMYHCKNAKGQNASLYLIPTKQDQDHTIPQPLMFRLTTTILSKILMKKIVVSTTLYEVLPIHLDIQLPSQIPESAQFNLSLFQQTCQQPSTNHLFNPQSFIFSQSHIRTLKQGNKDSFQLKLVPLSLGEKICKISYLSSIYGEFIYQIQAKIQAPKVLKEFRLKDLKVNVQEQISIVINKQNELMNSLLKVYYPDLYNYQCKTQKNLPLQGSKRVITSSSKINLSAIQKATPRDLKYQVQLVDNPYVTIAKGYNTIEKLEKQNKIVLKTNFTKPCKDFSVILSVKNELLKDRRLYKLIFVVVSPPKVIKIQFKTAARQQITQKLPIKISPCEVTLKSTCDAFTIENLCRQYFNNTELVCHFRPQWILQKQVSIQIQNKQSLEQIIYEISLKAEEPQNFGTFELVSSSLFNQQVIIPIDVQQVFSQIIESQTKPNPHNNANAFSSTLLVSKHLSSLHFDIKRMFKRPHSIQNDKFCPFFQLKNIKSLPVVKLTSNDLQLFAKDITDKFKVNKTRSLVDDRSLKSINMTLHPSDIETQTGSIRLSKPHSQEYYWAKIVIKNRPVKKLKPITLQQKLNHTKIQPLDHLVLQQGIDFSSSDFEFKFSQQERYLKFNFLQVQPQPSQPNRTSTISGKQKKPCIIFSPLKQIQTERTLYFKSNNQQFMLLILLKADPMPTIVVPEITTLNIEPKLTYINLINGTDQSGVYTVVVVNHDDPKNQSWRFMDTQDTKNGCDWIQGDINNGNNNNSNNNNSKTNNNTQNRRYQLKAKQKKQIKIGFQPRHIHQKQKFILKFQSPTLPNYTYILNGKSQFKMQQQHSQFQIYQDHIRPFHVDFVNLFQKKECFSVELQMIQNQKINEKLQEVIRIEEPVGRKFSLGQGDYTRVVLAIREEYFRIRQGMMGNNNNKNNNQNQNQIQNQPNFKLVILIKTGEKIVKKYFITLLVIKNLFSSKLPTKLQIPLQKLKTRYVFSGQKHEVKQTTIKNKNYYHWSCKARQTIYQTIQIPSQLNFTVKQIKCPNQILKFITFTCISQSENSAKNLQKTQINHLKIKYSPMKPIKRKKYDFVLIGTKGQKYRIECQISVQEPAIDDTIIIKTSQIDQIGCVSFKLTNTTKSAARYKAYFVKKLPQFGVQAQTGILQGYGKPGTPIMVKFKSHINNRRLEDKLIIETDDMYWCFKVKGMIAKDGH